MPKLAEDKCRGCRGGDPPLSALEIAELHPQVPDWKVVKSDSLNTIERVFPFPNFAQALAFTNQVGVLAEEQGHHPVLKTEWGRVTVTWWTHKIKGLHRDDFIMAAKTDRLFETGE
ncbi:MAG: 4a-hydroxytetrahydrobiopterin dehydratase [Candidatus Zixiibacteriota bacterium]|nr:MAG: 4a-hydroxytetrahydrobiopterin dehydratase [candidate division Zixibacteria bacterium]